MQAAVTSKAIMPMSKSDKNEFRSIRSYMNHIRCSEEEDFPSEKKFHRTSIGALGNTLFGSIRM